jgi:hypothetical protein
MQIQVPSLPQIFTIRFLCVKWFSFAESEFVKEMPGDLFLGALYNLEAF